MKPMLVCLLALMGSYCPLGAAETKPAMPSPTASVADVSVSAAGSPAGPMTPQSKGADLFTPGRTEAAYQADEHIYGRENHVIGRNTAISVTVEAKGNQRRVVVGAPADQFKTDSSLRDGRVSGLLGGSAKQPVLVSSGWFAASDLGGLEQGTHQIPGDLSVRGKSAQVTLTVKGDGKVVRVDLLTSFKALGLEPPALGPFGIFGQVHQPLALSAQIQLDKVPVAK